jgi:NitT/TauT family transport system substrate-binding protein
MENNIKIKNLIGMLVMLTITVNAITGCSNKTDNSYQIGQNPKPFNIKLAYFGDLCELPLFAALEKGFFKKDGIEAALFKSDFDAFAKGLGNKALDGCTCDFQIFRSIEKGLDIKLVAGIHGVCTQIVASKESSLNTIRDLNGKTIGVEGIGNAPTVIASMLLQNNDINPLDKVSWKEYKSIEKLKEALNDKKVDAIAIPESQSSDKNDEGLKVIYSSLGSSSVNHSHKAFQHFYASFIGLSGDFVQEDDKRAFYVTRAWLKAAQWVQNHQQEAIQIAINKNYINGDLKTCESLTNYLMWSPGVRYTKKNIEAYIEQQINLGLLSPGFGDKKPIDDIFVKVLPDFKG